MSSLSTLLVASLVFAAGMGAGAKLARDPLVAQLSAQEAIYARASARAAERNVLALQAAQQRGDALSSTLAQRQALIDQLTRRSRDAIPFATTGRPCLGSAALRMLNGAAGIRVAGLPESPRGTAPAGGPAAADSGDGLTASDGDIASWAIDAGAAFESCRARLDALIDWEEQR